MFVQIQNKMLLGFICIGLLSACGIKPGTLTAPEGAEDNTFPRTYPAPETDPAGKKRY